MQSPPKITFGKGRLLRWIAVAGEDRALGNRVAGRVPVFQASRFPALPLSFYRAPPPGFLKLNREDVVHKNAQSFGVSVAIRDDKGKVLVARLSLLMGSFSYEIGQLLAIRKGLLIVKFYHFSVSILESSSLSAISILSNAVNVRRDDYFIVNDIKALISDVGICKCQASSLKGNSLAHRLAWIAFSSAQECLWLDPGPSLVSSVLYLFSCKSNIYIYYTSTLEM
ncbi:hypothetical protein Ddye_000648 [Dipteronia dyeriana]|uniref:RNase H type-1 domain-containing protein n=1 Tax=Dipteronia dyeriana TaxID=168575 RepID=A0AAD9XM34_9ROSI|nr:hypothetical protein Ddye_000648 [Dipteronia dyeriana]